MAFSWVKTAVIGVTSFSAITIGAISWTGGVNLDKAFQDGQHMQTTINQMASTAQNMLTHFNNFKASVQQQLNDKIATVNSLTSQIGNLNSQVASGTANASQLQAEIVRLNNELATANAQAQDLQTSLDGQVASSDQVASSAPTDASMNDTLALNTQNTVPDGTTTTSTTTTAPTTTAPATTAPAATDYSAQEQTILGKYTGFGVTSVTMTASTITMVGSSALTNEAQNLGTDINANVTFDHVDTTTNTVYYNYTPINN